ncbi:MAG: ClpXP protease specificity-enhancing factor [Methylotetracoccus sp.]|jgi:stringent starvation protein B|nr:ClpXP protease specificity-enhancing factor [Methylotetracoccus sp.]
MTPLKPYLIRALYEWIIDNDLTPYLLVDAEHPEAVVPRQYVQDGKIVLNLKPQAISALALGNRTIAFNARFGGTPMQIDIPLAAALALYAKETGKGMVFEPDEESEETPPPEPSPPPQPKAKAPFLKVVK